MVPLILALQLTENVVKHAVMCPDKATSETGAHSCFFCYCYAFCLQHESCHLAAVLFLQEKHYRGKTITTIFSAKNAYLHCKSRSPCAELALTHIFDCAV